MISEKEHNLDRALLRVTPEGSNCRRILDAFLADEELRELQEYANIVSIRRLGFNDHGPVHMRQVAINAIRMLCILRDAGVKTNLEAEEIGSFDDSLCAVFIASFTHDLGMSVGRDGHERMSVLLALPFIDKTLAAVFPDESRRRMAIRTTAVEGIIGHMCTQRVHSLEA
ncbi:MAG: phosphohydrolase, partial [Kiritimatiellaeota bacterium]|nr:phosphohydrolase [Kiritimatiellota bacterium]